MKYLLDSNAWIAVFRGRSDSLVRSLEGCTPTDIVLCSVVLAELWHGVFRSRADDQARNRHLVEQLPSRHLSLAFDDAAAMEAAAIRAGLAAAGTPIGPYDLQIAAIARNRQLVLVTNNTAEFSRVPNLVVENWQHR